MESFRNRDYCVFLVISSFCIVLIMTLLSFVTIFSGAFPERMISFFKVPSPIILFFYFGPLLTLFGIAYCSPRFIDALFNLSFYRSKELRNSSAVRILNKTWKLQLRNNFIFFGFALGGVVGSANRSFYWLRQGEINFSNWLMAGAILIYTLALFYTARSFIVTARSYLVAKDVTNLTTIADVPIDPFAFKNRDNGTVNANENGFYLHDDFGNDFVDWSEIQEVRAYKRERSLDAELGLDFLIDNEWWKVSETMAGYHNMQTWLPRKLTGFDENWSEKVLAQEVRAKHYVIWKRDRSLSPD